MSRKALAVVLASAVLWTGIATAAPAATEPAKPAAQTTEARAPAAGNQAPLPPGPARIRNAQGLGDDDLGPGVIIGSIVVVTALLFWMLSDSDDENPYNPPATTN